MRDDRQSFSPLYTLIHGLRIRASEVNVSMPSPRRIGVTSRMEVPRLVRHGIDFLIASGGGMVTCVSQGSPLVLAS